MSNWIRAECPSLEIWVAGVSSGLRMLVTSCCRATVCTTTAIADWKLGSVATTSGLWTSTLSDAGELKPAFARMRSARPASPEAMSASESDRVPIQPPRNTMRATNASQPKVARFQWRALHPPARAARFRLGGVSMLSKATLVRLVGNA